MGTKRLRADSRPTVAEGAGDDLELDREEWAAVYPRQISPEQWRRFE